MPRSHVGVNLACNSSVISWSDLHALRLGKSLALQACADLAHMPLTRGVMMPATRGWNKWPSLKCDVKAICHRGNQRQEKYKQRNKKTNTHHARPHQEPGMAGQSFLLCNALVTEQSTCWDVVCARAILQRLLYQNLCRSDQYILYDSDDSEPMWKLGLTSEFLEGGRPPWYFKTPDLENSKLREAAWIAWQI